MKLERGSAVGFVPGGRRATTADDASREPTTVRPPFDPEKFAKESDSKLRVLEEAGRLGERRPAPSNRPTVPPPPGLPDYAADPAVSTPSAPPPIGADVIPELVVAREDLEWFDLTVEARSLLQHVDGESSVGAICEKAQLSTTEVFAELERLAGEGLVSWR
jgi:hypothetical protein